jgi:response regulator of citrate/malate metabolism
MVSTENEKEIILKAIIDGATDYIIKPFTPELVRGKLLARIK